jgi:Questin oxidase-like
VKEGDKLTKLVSEWADEWLDNTHDDADVENRVEGMVEEVVWGNPIWFGVGGWHARGNTGRTYNADFFMCVLLFLDGISRLTPNSAHLVTSAIFLLTVVLRSEQAPNPPVPLLNRLTLLKAYLATCAGWYISRGNAAVPIKDFF